MVDTRIINPLTLYAFMVCQINILLLLSVYNYFPFGSQSPFPATQWCP